jgi:hypothetical protein
MRGQDLERYFDSVEKVGHVGHPYAMPDEHFPIYYCRRPKIPLEQMWPKLKSWN